MGEFGQYSIIAIILETRINQICQAGMQLKATKIVSEFVIHATLVPVRQGRCLAGSLQQSTKFTLHLRYGK